MRHIATHWIVECKDVVLHTEKLRPLLRAIYPEATPSQIAHMASCVHRSGEEGHTFRYLDNNDKLKKITIVRRECHKIYRDVAEQVLGNRSTSPFQDDIDSWMNKFAGRTPVEVSHVS